MNDLITVQISLMHEIREYCCKSLIGKTPTEDFKTLTLLNIKQMIARVIGCKVEDIELINPRWEDEDRIFVFDGFKYEPRY